MFVRSKYVFNDRASMFSNWESITIENMDEAMSNTLRAFNAPGSPFLLITDNVVVNLSNVNYIVFETQEDNGL